ncbi:MAG: hypothetical protein IJE26_01820, partial [Oscillospiraceae bacterium]|nr:hypothetical protein [Oscillospiraceae bacterium]
MKKGWAMLAALLLAAELGSGGKLSSALFRQLEQRVSPAELAAATLSLELGRETELRLAAVDTLPSPAPTPTPTPPPTPQPTPMPSPTPLPTAPPAEALAA